MTSNVATYSSGAPLPPLGLTASQSAGPNGPLVLQDFALLDHLAHFDHERIPERVVHAKGAGAFGYFEVTHDISAICSAKMFSNVGKQTPVAARFSQVGGEQGSADSVRDPRGFALKFYTEDGNWDLVGNNTPIFFIRDPILFPSFIHTQKRHPSTHLKDPSMTWDFYSLRPESTHQVSFLFSDRGIPDGYRHMHGYGSHTFENINADGVVTYVKYHFHTSQGIQNLGVDDATALAGSNPDYAMQDLYEAIAREDFPSWALYIQTMTQAEADQHLTDKDLNPFDVTKVWSHKRYPLQPVGKLVLNRNPTNYFSEVEQLAFSPAHFVPGIQASPDKMLQGRLFSYSDTQRYRLGVNYQQIPVNRPVPPAPQNYQRDGFMTVDGNQGDAPNYFPNSSKGPDYASPPRNEAPSTLQAAQVGRYDTQDDDNFSQVGVFYREVLDDQARDRLAENIAQGLHLTKNVAIQDRAVANFTAVDSDYGERIKVHLEKLEQSK
ncbi:unnamed protein product [Aphanomyces euteiches]|uniref:Catalase n=1 Tax=Aphanomyces euteiches TaxID=100861 RepID=A0A6G0X338_9STRA|nr:hypothetical protein Ae201684_009083 [Aphanomyces euteiches]KAH9073668.1 hypothetical protein Ae201684P_003171 [Aphanomyces euteiches]KAH9145106.1 hypothetical protein AeRB84_010968 [Aphanomyces euteiches]